MSKNYGSKEIIGDSACPTCRAQGKDSTGNHLIHWKNNDSEEEWVSCNRCGHYEVITEGNRSLLETSRNEVKVLSEEEVQAAISEVEELPIKALTSRGITREVAERYGVRVGLSQTDGETVISHFYPKTKGGVVRSYKVRSLDPKYFFAVGDGRECDLFGIMQARKGDVYSGKLFLFEDELSCMSGYQALDQSSKTQYKPACVSLPDGSKVAATALSRNRKFIETFDELVVCMDNDEAGEEAVKVIRSIYPKVKIARIPKGKTKDGKDIKDANDLLMEGRCLELSNALRFTASSESPAAAVSVSDCIEDALKKPEWGLSYPWPDLTDMTYGAIFGEMISIGGGVGSGKTLLAHEMCAHYINEHGINCGTFMLEETVGNSLKNIAGKSANIPFHLPDLDYDPQVLRDEAMKYNGKLFLYQNFGSNEWADIKQCIRFWVIENQCKFIFLDNITCLVSHLTPSEINTEVSRIASELSNMCNELNFTCYVFSHLNPPQSGASHEDGGQVREVQFTGSRALMRFSQLMLGFERSKQESGMGKHNSIIRLLKDRKFGRSGEIYTKYIPATGRLVPRPEDEVNPENPFAEFMAGASLGEGSSGSDSIF